MHRPDALDVKILKELGSPASFRWDVMESFANIARKLEVDEETVRKRLARMRQAGALRGWRIIPNPHLIGQEVSEVELELADDGRKDATISQIKLVEGVIMILNYHGARLRVVLYYDTEETLRRRVQLIASICGCEHPDRWKTVFPPCNLQLRETDWRIVKQVGSEPRRKLADIARQLKVSPRTVKRRMDRMTKGNAFFLMPVVDLGKITIVSCGLVVAYSDPGKKKTIDNLLLSKLGGVVFANTAALDHSTFGLACANVNEAEEICGWIRALDGVAEVRMGIEKEILSVHEWLDQEIDRHWRESRRK